MDTISFSDFEKIELRVGENVADFMSEWLIVGVPQPDGTVSLLTPSKPAVLGGKVY